MTWDDDKVELLKRLWAQGLSASQISRRIRGFSRMAVIGKVHRLGLDPRHGMPGQAQVRRRAGRRSRAKQKRVWINMQAFGLIDKHTNTKRLSPDSCVAPPDDYIVPARQRKQLLELEDGHCRWPVGDPLKPDFYFCGAKKIPGLSYCEHHARRAFQPPPARRTRIYIAGEGIKTKEEV